MIKKFWCRLFHKRMWVMKYGTATKQTWFCLECGKEHRYKTEVKSKYKQINKQKYGSNGRIRNQD